VYGARGGAWAARFKVNIISKDEQIYFFRLKVEGKYERAAVQRESTLFRAARGYTVYIECAQIDQYLTLLDRFCYCLDVEAHAGFKNHRDSACFKSINHTFWLV
jgi:hypothetical protein